LPNAETDARETVHITGKNGHKRWRASNRGRLSANQKRAKIKETIGGRNKAVVRQLNYDVNPLRKRGKLQLLCRIQQRALSRLRAALMVTFSKDA
jgi:hypothetical protein